MTDFHHIFDCFIPYGLPQLGFELADCWKTQHGLVLLAALCTLGVNDTPARQQESNQYVDVRFSGATPAGVADTVIPPTLNGTWDPWAQDEFQMAYQESPDGAMYVVLDSKRDRGLQPYPPTLLGPDFGHIQVDDLNAPNSLDAFGNLEVSPPNGASFPLGRVYYGFDPGAFPGTQMDETLRDFLARQDVQLPATFDSDWLLVGHVDEFMSIVPNPYATYGWTVLLADPVLALDILTGNALVPGGVDEALHLPKYQFYGATQLAALLGRPTSDGSTTIEQYNAIRGPLQAILQELEEQIVDRFNLLYSEDVYRIPVLLDAVPDDFGNTKSVAITPDIVNGASYGSVFIAPDPFLHAYTEEDVNMNFVLDPADQAKADALMLDDQGNFVANAGFEGYKVPLVWSKMLTVWRKLHVEVDSMAAESQSFADRQPDDFDHDSCTVAAVQPDVPSAGFTTVQCAEESGHAGYSGTDFYEGGAFFCAEGGPEWLIVRSIGGPYLLTLWGTIAGDLVGQACTIRDDDLYFADPLAPRQLPRTTVVDTNIQGACRDAYIDIVEAQSLLNLGNIVPWKSHLCLRLRRAMISLAARAIHCTSKLRPFQAQMA